MKLISNSIDFNVVKARLVLSSDITAKMEMEHALNLSEQWFKAMVQEGSDLINVLNLKGPGLIKVRLKLLMKISGGTFPNLKVSSARASIRK